MNDNTISLDSTMKHYFIILVSVLTVCCSRSHAQEVKQDPIDQEYYAAILKDTSVASIGACSFTAYKKWEKEMNNAYDKLNRMLKKDKDKQALRQSQTAWKAYRDAEFTSYDHMFNRPGSKWCFSRQDGRVDVVRARALQLRSYIEALKLNGKK